MLCRDEVCRITVSGRWACYEDGNIRAAIQGIADLAVSGPPGGRRSRYVVESRGELRAELPNWAVILVVGPSPTTVQICLSGVLSGHPACLPVVEIADQGLGALDAVPGPSALVLVIQQGAPAPMPQCGVQGLTGFVY